jgi:hypothetical protein
MVRLLLDKRKSAGEASILVDFVVKTVTIGGLVLPDMTIDVPES